MAKNPALTGGELTALNSADHQAPVYLSYAPDVAVAHATVNGSPGSFPIIALATTAESAHWSDGTVRVNMTAKITSSDTLTLRGYYRVRVVPSAGSFFIDEVSNADPGMIAQSSRTTGIINGDLITIYERYDMWSVKPVTISGTERQDYSVTVGTHNQYPDPIVNVTFNGQADMSHFITQVANGGTAAISAVLTVTKWSTGGASTLTYAWSYPASWTGVSGATSDTLTATVPVGAYWLYCTITSSVGGVTTIKRFVRVHSPADPPVAINVTPDNRDRSSRKLTIRAVNSRISVIPDGALCFVWSDGTWGGSDVPTASRLFTGYLYRQPYSHVPGFYDSNAELLGTCAVLDLLNAMPAEWSYTGFLNKWTELSPYTCTIQFVIWWVLRWRTANVLECHNFTPFSVSASLSRRKQNSVDSGTIYSQLKYLADQYDLNVGSRSNGEIVCAENPSLLSDRTAVANRLTLTNSIYSEITVEWRRRVEEGSLVNSGIYCDLGGDYQIASAAPGVKAVGQGGKMRAPTNKVFESQSDSNRRTGKQFALDNNPYPRITITIPKNWDVFEPVDMGIVTVQVPANKSPTGSAISIDACPVSVSKTWIIGRRASLSITLEGITDGLDAETAPVPASQQLSGPYSYTSPVLPTSPGWGAPDTNGPIDVPTLIVLTADGFVARGN